MFDRCLHKLAVLLLLGAGALGACGGDVPPEQESRPAEAVTPDTAPSTAVASALEVPGAPEGGPITPTPRAPSRRAAAPVPPSQPAVDAPPDPAPDERPAPFVASGSALTFAIDEAISTKSNVAGDPFSARLVTDVLGEDGEVLLPAGAVLRGRVTESTQSAASDQVAVIRLAVESVEVGGETYPVVGLIEEMQVETEAKDSNRRTAVKVGVGAAAGAIAGRVIGGSGGSTAKGAAAGAAVAIVTRDGHATIPRGGQIVFRLGERLTLR